MAEGDGNRRVETEPNEGGEPEGDEQVGEIFPLNKGLGVGGGACQRDASECVFLPYIPFASEI
ncbi:hypothetical protein RchiOBHm_Chr7g0226041 [Rosa chinensis]|uniref:Uncharacterized protein n=1 Tax=Rosa chinensis TaxID=74649 RepID=A0A2P6PE87_ROSCH|nr:hypothetical protein RchiOBHm_Chr7g0226041 [Rosa chinensis]